MTQEILVGIARIVRKKQARSQGAAADTRGSTDIAPVFYRSSRGNLLAIRTTDIPEREQFQQTKKQPCPRQQPQGAKVLPFEFQSGVAEATSRFSTEYNSGACCLSRIDPKRDRVANEETCCGKVLFQGVRLSFVPHWHDCVSCRCASGVERIVLNSQSTVNSRTRQNTAISVRTSSVPD